MPQIVLGANRGGDWPGVWFASLAANPGLVCYPGRANSGDSHGRAPLGFHWERAGTLGTGMEELLSTEPLALLPWERPAENPGNRRAICLLEPLIPTSWRSLGNPEWGSWSQYQKDSGGDRKSAISGHLGGWPMEGVFFSYGVWSSHSVGVLRKGFSSF